MKALLKIFRRAWLVLFILFSLFFIARYFIQNAAQIHFPLHISYSFLVLTLLAQITFWLVASFFWRQIVLFSCSINPNALSLLESFYQLILVTLGKYFPGKVWGMLARGAFMKQCGLDARDVFTTTFYEQFILLHASFILSSFLALWLFDNILTQLLAIFSVVSMFLGPILQQFGMRIFTFLIEKMKSGYVIGTVVSIPKKTYFSLLSGFMLQWILNGLIFTTLYFAFFPTHVSWDLLLALILANTVGITVGFFALFAPGGIGVREAISSLILGHFIPVQDAVLLSLVFRLWLVTTDFLFGAGFLMLRDKSKIIGD